jgi:hypothetical protein
MKSQALVFCLASLLSLAPRGVAAVISTNVAPSGAIVDTSANYNASFDATHVIDGKIDEKQTSAVSYWIAPDGATNSSFILDLRRNYPIKSIVLYNTHNRQFNDRGTGQFQIYASDTVQPKAASGGVDRYYSFDGDVIDRSANGVNAVMLDGPVGNVIDGAYSTDAPATVKGGKSISFTGAGERVEIVDAPGSSQPTAYTLSVWVKFLDTLQPSSLVVRTAASGRENNTWSHQLRLTVDSQFQHYTYDGAEKRVTGTTVVEPNVWYHVAATAQNNGQARLYVNGVEEGTAVAVGTLWTGGGEFALATGSGHGMLPSAMNLDEVGIWFSALPADLIKRLNNGEKPNTVNNSSVVPTGVQLVSPRLILSGSLSDVSSQDPVSPDTFTTANGLTSVTARYLQFRTLSSVYTPTRNNVGLNEIQVIADVEATPPAVGIATAILVSWPYNPFGYVLQSSPSLSPATWSQVSVTPSLVGTNLQLFLPATNRSFYYRLLTP